MNASTYALFLLASMIALLALFTADDDLQQQQYLYCEMVAIHKDTGGQYGWPDYRGNAAEVCK